MSNLLGGKPDASEEEEAKHVVQEIRDAPKSVKKEIKLDQSLIMSEVQLLLADKRTAFALLRTGVTVSLVPLSIWTVLVATSKLYDPFGVIWLLVPILVLAAGLFILGLYLVVHALQHIRHTEKTLGALRKSHTLLEDLLYRHGRWHW